MSRLLRAGLFFVLAGAATACGGKEDGVTATTAGGASSTTTGGSSPTATLSSGGHSAGGASSTGGSTFASLSSGGHSAGGASSTGGSTFKGGSTSTGGITGGTSSSGITGGTTGAGGSSSGGTQAVVVFTTSYVAPYCTRLAECCVQAGYAAPSAATCQATELGFYQASLADGTAQPNGAGITALLSSIQNTCEQPSYTLFSDLTLGTRPVGSDCTDVSQCQGDSVACVIPGTATAGTCVSLTRGKLGDSCAVGCDNTSSCQWTLSGGSSTESAACWDEDGLRCDSTTNQCVALVPVGSACGSFVDCGVHASCVNSVCVAKGKLGENCSNGRSCESTLTCNSNSICVKMSIAYSGNCG